MELQLATDSVGDYVVVHVDGEVDVATSDQLRTFLLQSRQQDKRGVIVDLSCVPFMDCAGLRALVRAQREAIATGGELRLAAPRPGVSKVLALSDVYLLMPPFPTVMAAATAVSGVRIVTEAVDAR